MEFTGKGLTLKSVAEERTLTFNAALWAPPLVLATLLIIVSNYNFLLFHTLAEFFAIIVAITMYVVAWHMYPFTRSNFLMYLGCGYFWIAMLDLFHSLCYKGVNILPITTADPGIQFWLSGRYLEAGVLLTAPLFLNRPFSRERTFFLFGGITAALTLLVISGSFPRAFIEGQGLTAFKIFSEYTIICILALALYHLWHQRDLLDARVLRIMIASILLTMCAEMAFTLYVSIYGLSNIVGHTFKLASFWLIFVAVIRTTLHEPFLVMARGANTYDAIPDATLVIDSDGIIRQANKAACGLAQLPENRLLGQQCHGLFHPQEFDTEQCPACSNSRAHQTTGPLELEMHGIGKWFDFSFSPVNTAVSSCGMVETIRDITDRKLAENLLRQSERYNRTLFESSPIGLVLCRMNGDIVDVNLAFSRIVGRSVEESLALSYWDITPEKYKSQEQSQLDSLNATGCYGPYEKEYIHKTGHLVPVRLMVQFFEKEGETYIWSTVEDIRASKQAEEALRASELRFRTLVEQSPFSIQILSPNGRTVQVNHAWRKLWGGALDPVEDYNILNDQQLVDKGIMPYLEMGFSGIATEIPPIKYNAAETTAAIDVKKDCWIRAFIYPVNNLAGDIEEVILMYEDITDRKEAEERLHLSAVVFENTTEGIVIADANNNIISVNKSFVDMTGYKENEVQGMTPCFLHSFKNDDAYSKTMLGAVNEFSYWQGEIWEQRKNGEVFPTWQTITSVHDCKGDLTNYISVLTDISPLKNTEQKLAYLAHYDSLTQLPNRLLLHDRLEHAVLRAKRDRKKVAILFVDLDRFKNINDSLGHDVGDLLLKESAKKFTDVVRVNDTVSRLGGDEFVIVMEDFAIEQDVATIIKKLMHEFDKPFSLKGYECHITLSVGVSFYPTDGEDSEVLIKNADAAMYRAKEEGRNNYRFYTSALTSSAFERLKLENSLRHAIKQNELLLYYQPKVSLLSGAVLGAEALIRWQHPEYGLMLPEAFISLAEETGLILPIGEWVLRTACTQFKLWQSSGLELDHIAVNVSAIQIRRGNLVSMVKQILQETQLNPHRLELELTESTIMEKTKAVTEMLEELRHLGVTVAIDDFGTGYSSLSYLKSLPINKLKIDQSFIHDIPNDKNDMAITHAINALGQSLQLGIVAEGVESKEQKDFLESLGCDEAQGYLYSRPIPTDEFVQFTKDS